MNTPACRILLSLYLVVLWAVPAWSAPIDPFEVTQTAAVDDVTAASSSVVTTDAIGGTRSIEIANASVYPATARVRNCASPGGQIRCFSHSQDAFALVPQTTTVVTWDADSLPGLTDPAGLGGLNLTADGADAFELPVYYYDYPGGSTPIEINILLFHSGDSTGATFASGTIRIEQVVQAAADPDSLLLARLPFASFIPVGATVDEILTSVGAIQMVIPAIAPAFDIELGALGTNGICTDVPVLGRPLVDDCGVCSGDNSSCADCLGVSNGRDLPGAPCSTGGIGVCGEGKYDADCTCQQIVPASAESCDRLDNDCDGQIDEITDRCGVCGGDGRSCLNCTFEDQTGDSHTLDQGAKKQERAVRRVVRSIKRILPVGPARRKYRKVQREAHALQNRNWILAWQLPAERVRCESLHSFCQPVETTSILSEYLENNLKLWRLYRRSFRELKALQGGVISTQDRSGRRIARRLFKSNRTLAKTIPLLQYLCDEGQNPAPPPVI